MREPLRLAVLIMPLALALALVLPGTGQAAGQVSTILEIAPVTGTYGDAVTVVATLKDADTDAGIPGMLVNFLVNGQFLSATTDSAGQAVISGATLAGLRSGSYPEGVQARFDGFFGATVYDPSTASAVLTVDRRPLRVIPDSATREYGDPNPARFPFRLDNFAAGEDSQVLTALPVCTTPATIQSQAGKYAITCSGLSADNYVGDYSAKGTLTVTPVPMLIRPDDQFRLYGQANPVFTASYVGTWKLGQSPASLTGALKCSTKAGAIKLSPAGSYAIVCAGQTAVNYALKYGEGNLQIAPAPLQVSVGSYSREYGAPEPAYRYSAITGFVNGESAKLVKGALLCSPPDGPGAHAGTYDLDCDGLTAPNYIMIYQGTLAVTPAPLAITADDQSRTYGGADPAFTVTYAGWVAGDGPAALSGTLACSTPTTPSSPAETEHPITCGGLSASDYTITWHSGVLTITRAPLTVVAEDRTRTYGAANPALSFTLEGLVNGEDEGAALATPPLCTTTATPDSPVGSYPIECQGGKAPNYALSFRSGTLTVTPAALTITAEDATRRYLAGDPAFTVGYAGFLGSDGPAALTGTLQCTAGASRTSPPGNYPITCGGLSAANYALTFLPGTLRVTRASMSVQAAAAAAVYGDADAAVSALVSPADGMVLFRLLRGENAVSAVTAPAGPAGTAAARLPLMGMPAGTYTLEATALGSEFFEPGISRGLLTVRPAPTSVTVAGTGAQYSERAVLTARISPAPSAGQAEFVSGGKVLGSVPVDRLGVAQIDVPVHLPVGRHPLEVRFTSGDANLTGSTGTGELSVTPEDAIAEYTGPVFVTGSEADERQAAVVLKAVVREVADGTPGDIRLSTVSFVDRRTGEVLCKDVAVTGPGEAECTYQAVLAGGVLYRVMEIQVTVGGSYAAAAVPLVRPVHAAVPLPARLTAAGGVVAAQPPAGTLAGQADATVSFGFHAWVDRGGRAEGAFGAYVYTGGRVYRVTMPAVPQIVLTTADGRPEAVITGTALVEDITDPEHPETVDRAARLTLHLSRRQVRLQVSEYLSVTGESSVVFSMTR